jgi:hypothetical protein
MRGKINAEAHLTLLEMAGQCGKIPRMDPETGRPDGSYDEIDGKERLKVSQFLLDKAMPNTALTQDTGTEYLDAEDADYYLENPDELSSLNVEELRRLAQLPSRPQPKTESQSPW